MVNDPVNSIFIVGYMHSGTTLLKNILSGHPEIFSGKGESKVFEFLPELSRNYDSSRIQLRQYIVSITNAINHGYSVRQKSSDQRNCSIDEAQIDKLIGKSYGKSPGEIIGLVAGTLVKIENKRFWLEKTPTHIFHIAEIVSVFPDAIFVEIVRDPRGVLASKKVRRQTVFTDRYSPVQQPFKNLEKAYDPLWDLLSWKSAIRAGMLANQHYPENILQIRYEDLVNAPEETIDLIGKKIGVEFDLAAMEDLSSNSAYVEASSDQKGVFNTSVDQWKSILDLRELALIQKLAAEEMLQLGYETLESEPGSKFSIVKIYLASGWKLTKRIFNRYRMGGIPFMFKVIKGYVSRFLVLIRSKR